MVGGDSSAVVWTRNAAGDMSVSSDSGRSWTRVRTPPEDAQDPELARMLPDGRALLGPYNGQLWRRDRSRTRVRRTRSGPITTVLSAGARLYGLADTATERSLRHLVWMSTDDGSTWRQVIDAAGQPAHRQGRPGSRPEPACPAERRFPDSRLRTHTDFALGRQGLVLVTYGAGPRAAARLYDAKGRVVAESLTAAADVSPAGDGFVLSTDAGMQLRGCCGPLDPGQRPPLEQACRDGE